MLEVFVALYASIAITLYSIEYARLHLVLRIKKRGRHALTGTKDGTNSRYWYPFNRKPFNCEACLPFWLFAAFLPIAIYMSRAVPIIAFIATACTAGIITAALLKIIKK